MTTIQAPNTADVAARGAEMLAKAEALRPRLLAEQAETEKRTFYSPEMHEIFLEQGFYRMLQPLRYGGLELDLADFYRVVMSIARGCPSTGWLLGVGAGHALMLASLWPEEVQKDLMDDGKFFLSPGSTGADNTTARPVEGGYMVKGTWHFCSGAPYSNHHMGAAATPDGQMVMTIIERKDYEIVDGSWGDLIGLKGSGSHTINVENEAFVPEARVIPIQQFFAVGQPPAPGLLLHQNPLFHGNHLSFAGTELVAVMVGAAQGAVDEYARLLERPAKIGDGLVEGATAKNQDPAYQRTLGVASARAEAAASIVERCGQLYTEYGQDALDGRHVFTIERSMNIYSQAQVAFDLAWEAGLEAFRSGSSTGARDGQRMQRFFRDLCAYRSTGLHQLDYRAPSVGQARAGLPVSFMGLPPAFFAPA